MKESPLHGPDGAVGGREAERGAGAAPPRTPDARATPSRTGLQHRLDRPRLRRGRGPARRGRDAHPAPEPQHGVQARPRGDAPVVSGGQADAFPLRRRPRAARGVRGPRVGRGRTPAGVPSARVAAASHEAACADADPNELVEEMPAWARGSLVVGGQSMVGDVLANYLSGLGVKVLRAHANAYVSLARMYLGSCHAAVVDLWSEADGAYNMPYLRRMLPGVSAVAFRLYKQRVGFTVAAHNPRSLLSWTDLLSEGVRVANRERGAGTRVLLDEKLKYLEARADLVAGYDRPVASEPCPGADGRPRPGRRRPDVRKAVPPGQRPRFRPPAGRGDRLGGAQDARDGPARQGGPQPAGAPTRFAGSSTRPSSTRA